MSSTIYLYIYSDSQLIVKHIFRKSFFETVADINNGAIFALLPPSAVTLGIFMYETDQVSASSTSLLKIDFVFNKLQSHHECLFLLAIGLGSRQFRFV